MALIDVLEGPDLAIVPDRQHTVVRGPAPVFHLHGRSMSYVVGVSRYGHLETVHVGAALTGVATAADLDPVRVRPAAREPGVWYVPDDGAYCLDSLPLDWSGIGKGDYRTPAAEIRMPDASFVTDFTYVRHRIVAGPVPALGGLPTATGDVDDCATLIVTLADAGLELDVHYTIWPGCDVVTRRTVLRRPPTGEADPSPVAIRRLMSHQVDLPNRDFELVTFDGAWLKEGNRNVRPLAPGTYVNASYTGFSSNQHNPGVLLAVRGAGEDSGEVYGFNLVYSGNHVTAVELSHRDLVRVQSGINPVGFEWTLPPGEEFETPEAVVTWSRDGYNGLSANFHSFVGRHIVRGEWATRERPVVLNNWEATGMDFDHARIVKLAREGKRLGADLYVLDDGWFTGRDDDRAGLGDYDIDTRKLRHGLLGLAREVNALGLGFGLWFEPESVNAPSELYQRRPEWAVAVPGRRPSEQRHQFLLDLSRADVRDYIVDRVGRILDQVPIAYVKWDANRSMSDMWSATCAGGEFGHRYVLGLYDVLRRIFGPRPGVLLESCASGGNRFDLGMLCFSPQIWTSDNTDPMDRVDIQLGLSYLYPQSTMGAHVAASPSMMTLRHTPLSTRFDVAAMGVLGYELDPGRLTPAARTEMARQVAFYKEHRRLIQFGRLRRLSTASGRVTLAISDDDADRHLVWHVQERIRARRPAEHLPLPPLRPGRRYRVVARAQRHGFDRFGHLVERLVPDALRWLNIRSDAAPARAVLRRTRLPDAEEAYEGTGAVLSALRLGPAYDGTGWDPQTRVFVDAASRLYVVEPVDGGRGDA